MYQTSGKTISAAPSIFVVDGKQYTGVNALKNTALIISILILLKG